jgi:hypothetical protein
MRPISDRDKRTLRLASIGLTIYLALFFGLRGWKNLEAGREDYQRQQLEAQRLKQDLLLYTDKTELVERLKKTFGCDPMTLARTSVVAQASAAMQKAALTGQVQLGPIRESGGRPATRELSSMQVEATGPVPAVIKWLHRLEGLGFPLVIDTVQMSVEANKPGVVKINLTIVILDYEQWKNEEARRA